MYTVSINYLAFWLWTLLVRSSICLSHHHFNRLQPRQAIVRPKALKNFEVREPPTVPESKPCHQILLQHTFSNSYGHPADVQYLPPQDCGTPGTWASVIFNLTGTSIGTQYDRLGRLYLKDIEVWRTSTAEPTKTGIVWTTMRDMTKYIPLLSSPGPLSLELNNIVDPKINLTGNFEMTLSALFYPPTAKFPATKKADKIINWGRGEGNNMTSSLTFPQNLDSAFVEIFASGSAQEEFWYTNPPDEYMNKIDPNKTGNVALGKGPFREVQVWIDDSLAGVAYPFPVIYTGGILLSWWRPIAAIGAFDSPTYMIDISPFIPCLSESKPHKFTLIVEGQGEKGSINSGWFFSGSIFITLDSSDSRTQGEIISHFTDSKTSIDPNVKKLDNQLPSFKSSESLINFQVNSFRKLAISSKLTTGSGITKMVKFEQDFSYTNRQSWLPLGDYQSVLISSQGTSQSTHGDQAKVYDEFNFPMDLVTSSIPTPALNFTTVTANLTHGYERTEMLPLSNHLGKIEIKTTQIATGELKLNSKGRAIQGVGRTSQKFFYKDYLLDSIYTRDIEVFNVTNVIRDKESGKKQLDISNGYESMNSLVEVKSVVPGSLTRTLHHPRKHTLQF